MALADSTNKIITPGTGQVLVGTSAFAATGVPLNAGQLLIGTSSTTAPSAATLTAGTNITISSASGQVVINAATQSSTPVWNTITTASTAVWGQNYIMKANVTLTLPGPTTIGQTITVQGSPGTSGIGFTIALPAYTQACVGPGAASTTMVSQYICDSITLVAQAVNGNSTVYNYLVASAVVGTFALT